MALDLKQQLKLQHKLVMTPQLRQAIKILQLPRGELDTLVYEEMNENPVLTVEQGDEVVTPQEAGVMGDEPPPSEIAKEKNASEEIDWRSYLETYTEEMPSLPAWGDDDGDEERQNLIENQPNRTESLADHLAWQLRFHNLTEEDQQIAFVIIGNLDVDGYLQDSIEEIAASVGASVDDVARVLRVIQECEPLGVGARDLQECLLLQLHAQRPGSDSATETDPIVAIAERIVQEQLSALETRRFDRLARDLGVTVDEVMLAVKLIASLEPKPGRDFGEGDIRYVTEDVYVHKVGDDWVVTLNEEGLPRLKVSASYRRLLQEGGEAKDYIKEKLNAAAWLIKSIHQRQRTLLLVAQSLVKFQQDFLTYGVSHMRPLVLRDVAEDVGIHESTVSRAISNKYIATPRGIYPLKKFFTTGLKGRQGQDVASESVKERIRELIHSEDPTHPLSDEEIARKLSGDDVTIARRTVAKYREGMNILPSPKRKQLH
jgi:RNA polymerase sigma-54 factor